MALLGDILIGNITLLVGQDAELHARALASCIVMNRIFATYFVLVLVVFSAVLLWLSCLQRDGSRLSLLCNGLCFCCRSREAQGKRKKDFSQLRNVYFLFRFNQLGPVHTPLPPDRGAAEVVGILCVSLFP
jgi:hypothetical protein